MKFQTILLIFFGIMAVFGLVVFSKPNKSAGKDPVVGEAQGNVVIWGTYPSSGVKDVVTEFNKNYAGIFSISYRFHDPKTFDNDIIEALASGKGPDILLLPDDLIIRHSDKIALISYAQVPVGLFTTSYVEAAEIYMRDGGLVALPFAIDPLVLYWNRDIFSNVSLTKPPKYWDEFLTLTPMLTKRNPQTMEITQGAIALGEYSNITHAKDVLAMLFLQIGNPIVRYKENKPVATLSSSSGVDEYVPDESVVSAFRFFMDFSNPTKSIYTWSRAKDSSQNEFIAGNLAMHIDYASAYKTIAEKNPHLNFAVVQVPIPRGTSAEITLAKVHGLTVMKSSKNQKTAFIAVAHLLNDTGPAAQFAEAFNLPPVRRNLLAQKPSDAALAVFYDAAIRSRAWLDPRPQVSDKAFQSAVEGISSGRNSVGESVGILNDDLKATLLNY
jgi:ABC-type glycerol-3-phosphate transport system substrate-binding protein